MAPVDWAGGKLVGAVSAEMLEDVQLWVLGTDINQILGLFVRLHSLLETHNLGFASNTSFVKSKISW